MADDVSAGSTTTTIDGRLARFVPLTAFGLGRTRVLHSVTAADAVTTAPYVGGVALFVVGLLAFREGDHASGTAFTALGALWFTWAPAAGDRPGRDGRRIAAPAGPP
ncbi:hypothetical protein GTY54_45985, partial [Streptomyces sp. SID625]|nr:hypothetical protein [Streptomyces sp. SID625]